MSVIMAVKYKNNFYLGADTQTSLGDTGFSCNGLSPTRFKIKQINETTICGFAGRVAGNQIMSEFSDVLDFPDDFDLTKEYLVNETIPKIYELLGDNNILEYADKEKLNSTGNEVIIIHKDKMYLILDLVVYESNDFACIGSGSCIASNFLHTIDYNKDIEEQILIALRQTNIYDTYVSGPYVLYNTIDKKFVVKE